MYNNTYIARMYYVPILYTCMYKCIYVYGGVAGIACCQPVRAIFRDGVGCLAIETHII